MNRVAPTGDRAETGTPPGLLQIGSLGVPLRGFRLQVDLTCSEWPLILLGPSGSGKTTLLRLLAGLDAPASGWVRVDGEVWVDRERGIVRPAHRRSVGYCIQDHHLFPHMSALENVEFAARSAHPAPSREEARRRAGEELSRLDAAHLASAPVAELSGGEQSRVALARALARRPALLLLDEPFAALDPRSRSDLLATVRSVLEERGTPAVWVTHERTEALGLGGTLAVMLDGAIVQSGPPEEVFRRPASPEVAAFLGVGTILHGLVQARTGGVMRIVCGRMILHAAGGLAPGTPVILAIRAEEIELSLPPDSAVGGPAPGRESARNQIPAVVTAVRPLGLQFAVELDAGAPLTAAVTRPAVEELRLEPGREVVARIKALAVQILSDAWKPPGPSSAPRADRSAR